MENDTIAAIATSMGRSAVNIIKISGPESISIVSKIFTKDLSKLEPNTINYGFIKEDNELIDEVLVSLFTSPNSQTGEDIVEINTHGGISVTNKVLELVLSNGARLAEPGEFLKRAFLNGKKDLIEAEAISDLINAKTEEARKMSLKGLSGELSKKIKTLRNKILNIIANIEVNIDYPEYEDAIIYTNELLKTNINEIQSDLEKLVKESEKGTLLNNGINVGIVGKPNVGKSSLLNLLINEDKAIVTDIEGTTRDIVEGNITINGVTLNLIDTAGIRETNNVVEKLGVEKSKDIINKSDLIIALFDISRPFTLEDEAILSSIKAKKSIIILNKTDLPTKIDLNKFTSYNVIKTSVKEDIGKDELLNMIKELFSLNEIETGDFTYLSNARQISLIKEALKLCLEIKYQNEQNTPVDLIQIDLQNLWEKLGEITGDAYKDELLDEIFSKFCLGK
ncbi:MAG TPA: tRNA uridine-5-carboxymethylaminomethyl(34) synthesis GTPase MnmE [Firmicutes bacterium]|nr:tRNA uridine-5-carboxymethylaminomethyl(34) synthesis GTPase MnmE [Bacillota bacterium]